MEFDIKPYVVKDCSSNFDNMIQQVRSVKDGVGRVRRNISINSASTANIRTSLRNSQNNMEALIEKLASLENGLDVAVDLYLSCERNIRIGKADPDHIFSVPVAVGIADLTDEIQNTLPLGKRRVDLHVADVHQRRRVNGANIYVGCRICVHAIPPCLGYFMVMTG